MAAVDILTSPNSVNFDSEFIFSSSHSTFLRSPSCHDTHHTSGLAGSVVPPSAALDDAVEEFALPGLPPVHHGHSEVHLRNGVMRAIEMAADGEPEAEKAFFVADLSYVYRQHLRWKTFLPEVQPFYGKQFSQSFLSDSSSLFHVPSCEV